MTHGDYVLGIDMGTGSARAGVYDANGTQHGFGSAEWETAYPRPSWAEQDPAEWWDCTVSAVRQAVTSSGVQPESIRAISMDATSCTVVFLDAENKVLRPAFLWMDVRAVQEADQVTSTKDPALRICGQGPVSAEWGLPKSMWVKKNQPEIFERCSTICDETDWLVFRLTGEWAMSVSHAAGKYFYDEDYGGWPVSLYRALDAEDILDRYPSRMMQVGETVGELLPAVAEELGLAAGTKVIEGGIDAYLGAVGLGVAEPGKMGLITGSSHVVTGQLAKPIYTKGLWGSFTNATAPGFYTIDGGQTSTGAIIEWFRNHLAGTSVREAERTGESAFDVLTRAAENVSIGSDGLIMLDHFHGNRAPHFDARSRGMFWGLTLHHTEGHMFRALLEGICFGTEAIFEVMQDEGVTVNEVIVSGGATHNPLWLQMHADVSNLPMVLPDVTEGPALGSAMVAAAGVNMYPDIPTAARNMTKVRSVVEPDPVKHEEYQFNFEAYKSSYEQMKGLFAEVSDRYA